jgi:amidase
VNRTVGEFFTRYDVLVTPTVNTPAPLLGYLDQNDPTLDAVSWFRKVFSVCSFGPLFNCTGTPAISLPLGHTSSGLPLDVQFAAPMCREDILIQISSQLERAMPWAGRIPSVHVSR